jgi:hypothetical protein
MDFHIVPQKTFQRTWKANSYYLEEGNWGDWFTYHTTYSLYYVDSAKTVKYMGPVKIGQY